MSTVLTSGNASFNIHVPYKLIETGPQEAKPLFIYLHGYKQNTQYFQKKCSDLLSLKAYHLFIQGPYPIYDENNDRKVEQWGRAWYLYDGRQDQFLKSLEKTSYFIQSLCNSLMQGLDVSRISIIGYSMGGYLAGYFALSRPDYIDDLIVMGGRIKTEQFAGYSYHGLNVLHLHGTNDKSVAFERAKESCEQLELMGANVTFKTLNEAHTLTVNYIHGVKNWLKEQNIVGLNK